jgi:alcohol dehydrogenase class IV
VARIESAFEIAVSNVRFGAGVTRECGMAPADLGVRRALVITDPVVASLAPVQTGPGSCDDAGVVVEGTLPQHRVTKLSPRAPGSEGLTTLFEGSRVAW